MKVKAEQLKVGAIFKMEDLDNDFMRIPNVRPEGKDMIVICDRDSGNIMPLKKEVFVAIDPSQLNQNVEFLIHPKETEGAG